MPLRGSSPCLSGARLIVAVTVAEPPHGMGFGETSISMPKISFATACGVIEENKNMMIKMVHATIKCANRALLMNKPDFIFPHHKVMVVLVMYI